MIKIHSFCFVARKQTASRVFFGKAWFPASLQEIRQWCVQLAALCGRSSGNIIRTVRDVHAGPGDYTEASNPAKRQSQETDVMFVHYREKFSHVSVKKSDIFILLHLSTTSGPQESNSMFFQRKGIPDLWIAVQNIWNFRNISRCSARLSTVIMTKGKQPSGGRNCINLVQWTH